MEPLGQHFINGEHGVLVRKLRLLFPRRIIYSGTRMIHQARRVLLGMRA